MRALALIASLALAACHHAQTGTGPTNTQKAGAVDDLALLPVDSELVVGVHFGQLKQSGAWQTHVAPLLAKDPPGLHEMKALCGFDPLETIDRIALGIKGLDGDAPAGAIVVHGLDRTKAKTCFDNELGDAEKQGAKVTIAGDVVLVATGATRVGFTFVDEVTALVVLGADASTADGVKAIAKGTGTLRTSPAFVELYDKISHDDSVWGIANGNASAFQRLGLPFKLRALFGSMNVTDGITVDLRVRTTSADEASAAVAQLQPYLGQMRGMVDSVALTADGADMKLAVGLSKEKLQQLLMMVGAGGRSGEARD